MVSAGVVALHGTELTENLSSTLRVGPRSTASGDVRNRSFGTRPAAGGP